MHLKRLEIQGFKSFADRIQLEFNSGITAVVGPNGSGKSNISDAIRWVLGEQSAKTLRGGKMEDVIFAGTEHRKPMGFAEVSLTFDNSDGVLPIDFSEVTVTRRVYRSGESEYMINKTPCRLKDIYELFLDTGIGKDGYSIIGQGRVDEILSSKSEDRRAIFEEASGIMKYKVRKQEAEKKLEMTRQNLLRINDIIAELENQLEPLREQSEVAKRYLGLRETLKVLEVNVYIENIARYKEKIKELEENYASVKDNIDSENKRLEEITSLNQTNLSILKDMEGRLEAAKQEYYAIDGNLEKSNSEIRLNQEKINNLFSNIERLDGEIAEIDEKIKTILEEEASKNSKIVYLQERYNEYSAKLEEAEKKLQAIIATLNENERHIENLKTEIMEMLDIQSDKKTQINNIKNHIEGIKKRQANIDKEVYQLTLEKDKECMKKEELSESIYKTNELIKNIKDLLQELTEKRKDLGIKLEEEKKKQNNVRSQIQIMTSRQKMLIDMERNLEGYNRTVRVILQACRESHEFGKGIHGALAQLFTVDKRYETAIEMALGGALQNIVTTSEEDAKRVIEYLKKNNLGRATFLPISSVKGKYLDDSILNQLKDHEGFVGVASDLIEYDEQYRGIILSLLGKVVVVESLDAGIRMARKFGYGFRIVSLDGDILSTTGSISGGSKEKRESGILSRNREISELGESIARLKEDDEAIEKNVEGLIRELEEITDKISFEERSLKDNELVKIRDESHLAQIEENIKRSLARIDMLKQEKEQLIRQEKDTCLELSKYEDELSEIERDIAEKKEVVARYQEKNKEEQSVRDALHNDITDYRISVNSILESMEGVKETLERLVNEKNSLVKAMERKKAEKARNEQEIKALQEKNEGLDKLIKKYEEEKSGKTFEIDRITEEKKIREEESAGIIDQITEINKNILLLQEEYSRIEVKKAKLESEMESIQNRMWDEYELTYTNALELKKDIGSMAQAQKRIAEIRNEIKELGPVNVAAIDEYIKTKERFEFMSAQKSDMEQAEKKLQKVINEMMTIMKRQFMEKFKLINENFNLVFRELFDGGRAELILVDKENVLESGIEIEVQPPGKKLQNLMLLSGGERAFTAIALLFAILRLNPTPFCVLDEIEAALDDANVYKFAQYLKKYSNVTQFAVITHRKGTMEAADTLYGVTMQEHGVSKVVSLKMGEKVG
ncbi:MAG TPA: chromosome segregation protein SMC [Hungateiclostridium thermocellum]|uniref:Chromosome partition protein Smc n=1 Tax=Acetivibrio thermocellus (strain ATCC 27405 / DSM 1237 / JCM 9322 / NBRC 103400 / NCIMB 10682 / NRRL B-4536 / VPI 7372) TaxID=203119 RepID=A3DDY2_ACET2|nr:chromosome segregation protein SMC [Acetivibrio thermocellus]ABN52161.1 chromosome segregation protein SMC [Acetivibrio thermocellus ATCC 27405]HBW26870.1 chromosome segregation protein SMC [Acetivibrio thermocellus]